MKTEEQVLSEWMLDEIRFDIGEIKGPFTRKAFESICENWLTGGANFKNVKAIRNVASDRVITLRDELIKAMRASGEDEETIIAWFSKFFAPRHIAKFNTVDEVVSVLRIKVLDYSLRADFISAHEDTPKRSLRQKDIIDKEIVRRMMFNR